MLLLRPSFGDCQVVVLIDPIIDSNILVWIDINVNRKKIALGLHRRFVGSSTLTFAYTIKSSIVHDHSGKCSEF